MKSSKTSFIEVPLGTKAVVYAKSNLDAGHQLAKAILARFDRFAGLCSTFVCPGIPRERLEQFEEGGKLPSGENAVLEDGTRMVRVRNADSALSELIEEHLGIGATQCVVIENPMASETDQHLARRKSRLAFCESHVFHILEHGDSRAQVLTALRESRSWWGWVGAFSRTEHRLGPVLEAAQFEELAEQVTAIFVGAYDGESFVLVRRDP